MIPKKHQNRQLDKLIFLMEENNKYLYSLDNEEKSHRWMKILHVIRTIAILGMMCVMIYNYIFSGNISLEEIFKYLISWTS